jgi:hypothetical protein
MFVADTAGTVKLAENAAAAANPANRFSILIDYVSCIN